MKKTLNRGGRVLRRKYRQMTRSPFAAPNDPPPLLLHSCYHKVGTVWFQNVLGAVGAEYGLRMLDHHSRIDRAAMPPDLVGSFAVVRDLAAVPLARMVVARHHRRWIRG